MYQDDINDGIKDAADLCASVWPTQPQPFQRKFFRPPGASCLIISLLRRHIMDLTQANRNREERFGEALGVLSIGLGMAELAATDSLTKVIGATDGRPPPWLVRAMGLREIASGVGMIAQPRQSGWAWARVVGDVIDLALLGLAFRSPRKGYGRLIATAAAVAGIMSLDVLLARQLSRDHQYQHISPRWLSDSRGLRIQHSVAINCPPERLYRYCRDLGNLTRSLTYLQSVRETPDKRVIWVVKSPNGEPVEWDTQIVEDRPDELISWRAAKGASFENAGSLRFTREPAGRGTILTLEMLLRPPMGRMRTLAQVFGQKPDFRMQEGLRRLKALIETGEIPTTKGQPSGRPESYEPVEGEVGEPLGMRGLLAR
jgi:uncharacterized membrane protein